MALCLFAAYKQSHSVEKKKKKDLCDSTSIDLDCRLMYCVVSQNGPELLPRVSMLLLLTRVISTATPRLQVTEEFYRHGFNPFRIQTFLFFVAVLCQLFCGNSVTALNQLICIFDIVCVYIMINLRCFRCWRLSA